MRTFIPVILGKTASINVRKVLWTIEEIGVEYQREDWGKGFASTETPEFLALNPNGLIPVLVTEMGPLWESNTICRYLATFYKREDLLPSNPWERAQVEKWMDWQSTDLNSSWKYAFMALVRKDPSYASLTLLKESVTSWNKTLFVLNEHLSRSGPYVCGESFTLADVVIGLSINRWLLTPMERSEFPLIISYFERLQERSSCKRWCSGIP